MAGGLSHLGGLDPPILGDAELHQETPADPVADRLVWIGHVFFDLTGESHEILQVARVSGRERDRGAILPALLRIGPLAVGERRTERDVKFRTQERKAGPGGLGPGEWRGGGE